MSTFQSPQSGDDDETNERGFPQPQFPNHENPRVWFLSAADSPIGIALIRHLLEHGDHIVAAASSTHNDQPDKFSPEFVELIEEVNNNEDWEDCFVPISLNLR